MTSSLLTTDTPAPVSTRDRARTALRQALARRAGSATAERAEAAGRRAHVRAERARRRATALQFGAYPAGRSAAAVLLPGGPGA